MKETQQHVRMPLMSRSLYTFFSVSLFAAFCLLPSLVQAQQYPGDFSSAPTTPKKDQYIAPVPRIFSSDVTSVKQAEKLDVLYDNLLMSLWNYGQTDFIYQRTLMEHMQPAKFQLTRYAKEFSYDMDDALANLNANYKKMMDEIEGAKEKYTEIKNGLRMADQKKVDPLWQEKITQFEDNAKTYFKMQHKFLSTYRNLVGFVLKQGGSYYYKQDTQGVYFYKFGSYHFFGKSIDNLKKINYDQRQFLKAHPPANVDALILE
ncbi:MAG: hypothetical protein ACRBDI_07550 [Alphaproteobacteria bacterium]